MSSTSRSGAQAHPFHRHRSAIPGQHEDWSFNITTKIERKSPVIQIEIKVQENKNFRLLFPAHFQIWIKFRPRETFRRIGGMAAQRRYRDIADFGMTPERPDD
jgi:hypothetical protein